MEKDDEPIDRSYFLENSLLNAVPDSELLEAILLKNARTSALMAYTPGDLPDYL